MSSTITTRAGCGARLILALLCGGAWCACGGDPDAASASGSAAAADCCTVEAIAAAPSLADQDRRTRVRIPDKVLVDQDGREVRLMSDLIAGKQVIVDFVFSTCTSVCPTLQTVFAGIQEQLGDRLGREVVLLSISVDPATDTPARLKAFANDYSAREGWYFLTGEPQDVIEVLQAFGVYTRRKEEHTGMFVLGDEPAGRWMYQSGFVAPQAVLAQLRALSEQG